MYALHYLLPFVVAGGLVVHLALLHAMGSGTASTVPGSTMDAESFLLYYYKDVGTVRPMLHLCYVGEHHCSDGM